jgi:galactofuranosylgalactofuranosylrhamnosyl-N-acetylglucosaminyl-diphospho-decaprenol beta-1,5/1,6-galactofuranosyltransferase
MKCDEGTSLNFYAEHAEVVLANNSVLSLNTYFNSFYEKFYAKYTELDSLYYLLKLEGDFQVSLYREQYGTENRELIHIQSFENCQALEPVKIVLPDSWRGEEAGRVYLEITCLSERGLFTGGFIATEQTKIREVSLGIIICTFKKEAYVKNTVSAILKDDFLLEKKLKIFVIDNGKTLKQDEFDDQRLQLIYNINVGGSGGFTRGLIQALQEGVHTHFLFMDDDIELETESIYKLFSLYEYANQDFAISGSMLDLYKKHILYEAGALYAKFLNRNGDYEYNPFKVIPLKNKLNLNEPDVINNLLLEDTPDFGAFWFFSFSKKVVEEIGLPMPFFIKADDIEFGLRITERLSKPIVAFPSIAVWHEPFYAKKPVWDSYYAIRNFLITHSIRDSLSYLDAVKFLTKGLLPGVFMFDYNSAEMVLRGFEDYMKGPETVKSTDPEKLHASIVKLSKSYNSQSIQIIEQANDKNHTDSTSEQPQLSLFKKILVFLTLNGHLMPNFLLSKDTALYWIGSEHSDRLNKVFTKKQVVIYIEGNNSVHLHKMNRQYGVKILLIWLQLVIQSATRWSSVRLEWKKAFTDFTSNEFWRDYLKLNEQP